MSSNIYLDLIENPISRWIYSFSKIAKPIDNTDEYCLIFPEVVNGKNTCILLYLDLVDPPFDDIVDYNIENSQYQSFILAALYYHVKEFYKILIKTLLDDKIPNSEILKGVELIRDPMNQSFALRPIDIKESEEKTSQQKDLANMREKYLLNNIRLGIYIRHLDNHQPPEKIIKCLLSDFCNSDSEFNAVDSDSDSDL